MSKKGNKDLFLLIGTLTKSEKRHFKLFAGKHVIGKTNKYVRLFDAISKQKEYDEDALRRTEKYISQLPQLKNRLYELILKSLRTYDSKPAPEIAINNLLFNASTLEKKGLYEQSLNKLNEAKLLSIKYEKHLKTAEIIGKEEQLFHLEFRLKGLEDYVGSGFDEEMEYIEKHKQYRTIKRYDTQMGILVRKQGESLYPQTHATFTAILKKEIFKKERPNASFEEKLFFRNVHVLYHYFTAQFELCYEYAKKCRALFDSSPFQRIDKVHHYLSIMSNLMIIQMKLEKYDELLPTTKRFRESSQEIAPYISTLALSDMIAKSFNTEIAVYLKTGEFEKGIALLPQLEKELQHLENPEYRILLYSQVAKLFFGNRNYSIALKWINKLLNDTMIAVREDVHCLARLINLIIHYELKNFELLEHIVKSTDRFLSKRNMLYVLEKTIIDFFKKNKNLEDEPKKKVAAFTDLKKKIAVSLKARDKNYVLDYFDFISWAESKIQNRTMQHILREKSKP